MKQFAVTRHWKDNLNDFQILESFPTMELCEGFIADQPKSKDYIDKVMKWELTDGCD